MTNVSLKSVAVQAAIFLMTLALGLALVEVALRVKNSSGKNYDIEMWKYAKELKRRSPDPKLGHEHVPDSSAVLQGVDIRINEYGMRGAEVPEKGKSRRVLFLGSSITLGWGVEEDKTVTSVLEQQLRAGGMDVEVLNAGIGNYNAERYAHLFLSRLKSLKPTDIVINYFINDAEILTPGGANWLVRNSQLAATFITAYNRIVLPTGIASLEEHYQTLYGEDSPGYVRMVDALRQIGEYAREHDIRVYLLMTPDIHQLDNYPFRFIHEKMKMLSKELDFIYVDPLDEFLELEPSKLWAMPGDPHPNATGHQIMADEMYKVMSNK